MKIGFSRAEITPPVGIELGGYAGYRPCTGAHDSLWCKSVVLEQNDKRYALLAMDLLSVDESLANAISNKLQALEIHHCVVAAIHSHAAPCGIILGDGPLAEVNRVADKHPVEFAAYTQRIIRQAVTACQNAVSKLEAFEVRSAQGSAPIIGSERHMGGVADLPLTAVQIRTASGRNLLLYQITCHPTVLGPDNLQASADFVGAIEARLDTDMAVFLNGAAGDISTRFTRQEQSFTECERLAAIAAKAVRDLLRNVRYQPPTVMNGLKAHIVLEPRAVEPEITAKKAYEDALSRWQDALRAGEDPGKVRILKSYVEGAGVALEFANTMKGIEQLRLPVTVFSFAGLKFATVPGEMFSCLWKLDAVPICYANGYYRYIADVNAYDQGYYEAMAAILARGQGERFIKQIEKLLQKIA